MKGGLIPGLVHKRTYMTTMEMRARQLSSDVLATPSMIALMEQTTVELMTPYLDENEQTVGIHVDVKHFAPTKIGQSVTITVELLDMNDNKLRFGVSAVNDQGVKIGAGTHRRAVIHPGQFAARS